MTEIWEFVHSGIHIGKSMEGFALYVKSTSNDFPFLRISKFFKYEK